VEWAPDGYLSSDVDTFYWSVVVLNELTINLQAFALLKQEGSEQPPARVSLQVAANCGTFRGRLEPGNDKRFAVRATKALAATTALKEVSSCAEPTPQSTVNTTKDTPLAETALNADFAANTAKRVKCPQIEAIMFEFSNAFSWWKAKDVELIVLRNMSSPLRAGVMPLPAFEPLCPLPLPLPVRCEAFPHPQSQDLPNLLTPLDIVVEVPEAGDSDTLRLAAHIDKWLEAANVIYPCNADGFWLKALLGRVAALPISCFHPAVGIGTLPEVDALSAHDIVEHGESEVTQQNF